MADLKRIFPRNSFCKVRCILSSGYVSLLCWFQKSTFWLASSTFTDTFQICRVQIVSDDDDVQSVNHGAFASWNAGVELGHGGCSNSWHKRVDRWHLFGVGFKPALNRHFRSRQVLFRVLFRRQERHSIRIPTDSYPLSLPSPVFFTGWHIPGIPSFLTASLITSHPHWAASVRVGLLSFSTHGLVHCQPIQFSRLSMVCLLLDRGMFVEKYRI